MTIDNFLRLAVLHSARPRFWSMDVAPTWTDVGCQVHGYDVERIAYLPAMAYPASWILDPLSRSLSTVSPRSPACRDEGECRESGDASDGDFPAPSTKGVRRALLGNEVPKLYNAMSFMNWQHGAIFNCHVVLAFKAMGFTDHRTPVSLMAPWNQAMKRWLAVGPDKPRARWKKRARAGAASEHLWIYTIEHGRDEGLHAHELCVVPREQVEAFTVYTRAWWERAAGMKVPKEAVFVRYCAVGDETRAYQRQVAWFRYIVKSLTNEATTTDDEGRLLNGREIFRLKEAYWESTPIEAPRLAGISRSLSTKRQREAGFVSRWDEGRFGELYSGWEFDARRERLRGEEVAERMVSVFSGMNL